MPTYRYRCSQCGDEFEQWQSIRDDSLRTHDDGCGGDLLKVLTPAGIVLKGSGFYKTDSRSSERERVGSDRGSSDQGKAEDGGGSSDGSSDSGSDSKSGDSKSGDSKGTDSKSTDRKGGDTKASPGKTGDTSKSTAGAAKPS
jgi:putative FmdB family regulatory protein